LIAVRAQRSEVALPARTEVAVIGGGPAGAAAALALARLGIATVLVAASAMHPSVGETLPPAARPVLDRLGLRQIVEGEGYLPSLGNWSVWGTAEPWGRDFIFNCHGHGWHLDRRGFDALLRAAARNAGAHLVSGTTLIGSAPMPGGGFRLHLAQRGEFAARLVLDATGRAAVFARQRGVRRRAFDRLVGIAAYVVRRTEAPHEPAVTFVEATAEGWWYSAPLPRDRMVAVLMTDAGLARSGATSLEGWLDRLAAAPHTAARLSRFGAGLASPPVVVPAASGRLDHFCDRDWLAIGDAAASRDPLSSEGIVEALRNGTSAGVAVHGALGGAHDALAAAAAGLEERWRAYRRAHAKYYAIEQRWPEAPFWRQRHRLSASPEGDTREEAA
jgi:flavin-dependent dehydrogenase